MVIEAQANATEIEKQQGEIQNQADKMEKLNLEVTVVVTEKMTLKKQLDANEIELRKMRKNYKEARQNYDLLVDENTKVSKQNSEYRGLILNNEKKLHMIGQEIQDLQKHIERKN